MSFFGLGRKKRKAPRASQSFQRFVNPEDLRSDRRNVDSRSGYTTITALQEPVTPNAAQDGPVLVNLREVLNTPYAPGRLTLHDSQNDSQRNGARVAAWRASLDFGGFDDDDYSEDDDSEDDDDADETSADSAMQDSQRKDGKIMQWSDALNIQQVSPSQVRSKPSSFDAGTAGIRSSPRVGETAGSPGASSGSDSDTAIWPGLRVQLLRGWTGVIRWMGNGDLMGLELDEPLGDGDGCLDGQRCFACGKKHGLFVSSTLIKKILGRG